MLHKKSLGVGDNNERPTWVNICNFDKGGENEFSVWLMLDEEVVATEARDTEENVVVAET